MDFFCNYSDSFDRASELDKTMAATRKKNKMIQKKSSVATHLVLLSNRFPTSSMSEQTTKLPSEASVQSVPKSCNKSSTMTKKKPMELLLQTRASGILKDLHKLRNETYQSKQEELLRVMELHMERARIRFEANNIMGAVLSAKKVHAAQSERNRVTAAVVYLRQHEKLLRGQLKKVTGTSKSCDQHDTIYSRLALVEHLSEDYVGKAEAIVEKKKEEKAPTEEELLRGLLDSLSNKQNHLCVCCDNSQSVQP